jgi:hypothetical protein
MGKMKQKRKSLPGSRKSSEGSLGLGKSEGKPLNGNRYTVVFWYAKYTLGCTVKKDVSAR